MDIWLERLYKLIKIIRPKTYNVIAKSIIALGAALVAESQLNIIQPVVVALYESMVGPSEILRELINGAANLWVGLFLIIISLIYHYLMTGGKDQVEHKLFLLSQRPDLELQLLNADLDPFKNKTVNLRGCIANVPPENEIPEYKKMNYNLPNMEGLSNVFNTPGHFKGNLRYYKERAKFLKVWGGSELIKLKIFNRSEVLATGVKVEIRFPRLKGISADKTNEHLPIPPSERTLDRFQFGLPNLTPTPVHYDVIQNHTNSEYCFFWKVNEIQANTHRVSDTYMFLRLEQSIDIVLTIFCDQLSSPLKEIYHLDRTECSVDVRMADLQSKDEEFNELVSTCVMDGYIRRTAQKRFEKYEHESQELVPRSRL